MQQTFDEASAGVGRPVGAGPVGVRTTRSTARRTSSRPCWPPAWPCGRMARAWRRAAGNFGWPQPWRVFGPGLRAGPVAGDAAALVAERGRLMQAAVPRASARWPRSSAATMHRSPRSAPKWLATRWWRPPSFNSPGQLVIAGHAAAVDRALARLAELGVKKAVKLPVSVPSHCALMRRGGGQARRAHGRPGLVRADHSVVQNAEARPYTEVAEIRAALQRQLYLPVRWTECVRSLAAAGITLAECGPGKVLAGLTKRIDKVAGGPRHRRASRSRRRPDRLARRLRPTPDWAIGPCSRLDS